MLYYVSYGLQAVADIIISSRDTILKSCPNAYVKRIFSFFKQGRPLPLERCRIYQYMPYKEQQLLIAGMRVSGYSLAPLQ